MPQPININNVPMNYFLHGVDAAREAQNASSFAKAPEDKQANAGQRADDPGPAAKMAQQLDVLLVKAAKASTQSLDGKAIKNSLLKLVTDGALDKDSLKLLGKTADAAAKTLKALDKFTEARLNDAIIHAERLARENKVVEGDAWGNETTPRRNSSNVTIELADGRQKTLSRQSSFDVNNLTCPSYFARDKIDRLFE